MGTLNSKGRLTLTNEQLVEVTGYKQREKQKYMLRQMGVPFGEDAFRRPVVFVDAATAVFCPAVTVGRSRKEKPNFDYCKGEE